MPRRSIVIGLLGAAAVVAVGGAIAYRSYQARSGAAAPPPAAAIPDPRLTYETPFSNVRPDVAYVGSTACVECHKDIAASYARHPMGRSMAAMSDAPGERLGPEANNPFERNGFTYRVERRGTQVFHREERRDAAGKVVAATECEARYVVGSGTRGKSYIIERDGRLFQSPISWFSEKGIWDLSPGFAEDLHFNRGIIPRCLACHCNQADAIDGPQNSYRAPVFHGLAIGCERCHGPGEQHVRLRESGERGGKPDHTIVNPHHLTPALSEAVCQQCHLQGEERVLPPGRQAFDFRPGLPLELFWTVFVRKPEYTTSYRSVGQVEQMHLSRCYQASGTLGCVSCHDPHRRPEPTERVAFYRDRCLACHAQKGCSVELAQRKKSQPDDSCIACHMSKEGSSNIPHTAVTDHRILRRPDTGRIAPIRPMESGAAPIVAFPSGADRSSRDLGIALAELARSQKPVRQILGRLAEPKLDEATRAHPDDAAAWLALGIARRELDILPEALAAFEKALALQPNLERAAVEAAEAATLLERSDAAIAWWRRAIEINPDLPYYHVSLARLHAQRNEWLPALSACAVALQREPINVAARTLLVTGLLRTAQRERARAEFDLLLRLRPRNEAELRRAFAELADEARPP